MFSITAHLPALQIGRIALAHYEERWLQTTIERAAKKAGHDQWFFAEHVARGVIEYLRQRFDRQSITLEELFSKIEQTLISIGFKDIAAELEAVPPPINVSLPALAKDASSGYELTFFTLIDQQVADARRLGAVEIQFTGLRDALKLLRRTERWTRSCQDLHDYVLTYVPSRAARYGDAAFTILIR
ncbi:MAG: hypothetical protein ACI9R3_004608 [Verrucomicrobiales bacterium]|jgi:hypothetical protein